MSQVGDVKPVTGGWAKFEHELIEAVKPQIAEQAAKLKKINPDAPASAHQVDDGFIYKLVRAALDPALEAALVESVVQKLK